MQNILLASTLISGLGAVGRINSALDKVKPVIPKGTPISLVFIFSALIIV